MPTIFISGYVDGARLIQDTGEMFLGKPFTLSELTQAIDHHAAARTPEP